MTDDNERPARVGRSKKSIGAIVQGVARPSWRSPLFWWLIEHHDELRRAEANTGRGVPWQSLCEDFPDHGITLADGRPVTPATAKRIWQRVRKEIVRVEERRAQELAEREARRAADPRRNMPSRFPKREYGPCLSDVQPTQQATRSVVAPSGAKRFLPSNDRLSPEEQRARGLQLSTAAGVVVTKVSRVFKLPDAVEDFEFEESGMIKGRVGWSSALSSKQQMNIRSGRRINDDTEVIYANLGMEIEIL